MYDTFSIIFPRFYELVIFSNQRQVFIVIVVSPNNCIFIHKRRICLDDSCEWWDTFASISLQRDYSRKWKIIVRIFLYFFYFICWHLRRRDKCRGKVQDFPFKFSEKFYFVYYMQSSDPRSFAFTEKWNNLILSQTKSYRNDHARKSVC